MFEAVRESVELWRDYFDPSRIDRREDDQARRKWEADRVDLIGRMERAYRKLHAEGETEQRVKLAEAMTKLIDARWGQGPAMTRLQRVVARSYGGQMSQLLGIGSQRHQGF